MTPLSNRNRQESNFMILKLFNYVISDIIDDVIVKNSLIYTIYGILERKLTSDYDNRNFRQDSDRHGLKDSTKQLHEEINAKEENFERS